MGKDRGKGVPEFSLWEVEPIAKQEKKLPAADTEPTLWQRMLPIPLATAFFMLVCLLSPTTSKAAAMWLIVVTVGLTFLCFGRLRERMSPVMVALVLFVAMGGVSTLYARSGKFALQEFLKMASALCLTLLLLAAAPGRGEEAGRWIGSVLEGFSALAGLVSIDLISTRALSGAVLELLSAMTPDYAEISGLEAGTRMTSLFGNPNVFAGVAGLGTLLSLGLAATARGKGERAVHVSCLYVSALSFMLAFSMGASAMIAAAFLAYLAMESGERRPGLFALMAQTLVLTMLAAALVSMTSFDAWTEPRPAPLLCAVAGAGALCVSDRLLSGGLSERLRRYPRGTLFVTAGAVALVAAYVLLSCSWTGRASVKEGEILRRAAYPAGGEYTLSVRADGPVSVQIESQNRQETMMHTSTRLWKGAADGAAFTVPEDSLVVYFNFTAEGGAAIEAAEYEGAETGSVPLGYPLLPGFIANRLQGLFANQNAIQRLVFFSDALKLFRRAPVWGRGLGGFENGVKSVQAFYYETKYAHNHYIQCLAETGVVGLALFLGLLAVSAVTVWRARKRELVPMLAAALVFMAGHAAVEVVFSTYSYLGIAFGVFAMIGLCGEEAFRERKAVQSAAAAAPAVLLAAFGFLLSGNMRAASLVQNTATMESLVTAAEMDRFEWPDHMLTYVVASLDENADEEIRAQADEYAGRLSQVDSNTIPLYLSEYYLRTGRREQGFEMAEKYVDYCASDGRAWRSVFNLLEECEEDTKAYRAGVLRLAAKRNAWNRENAGEIKLSKQNRAFIKRIDKREKRDG